MALIKIGSNGLGTGVGGSFVKLLDTTISSAVAQYDIDSTYVNSTYDTYFLDANFLPATDSVNLYARVFVGDIIQTGASYYGFEVQRVGGAYGGANDNDAAVLATFNSAVMGNASGEGITINATFQNTNNTDASFCVTGISNWYFTDGAHNNSTFGGAIVASNKTDVVNGIRLYFSSGNIASGSLKFYGVKK